MSEALALEACQELRVVLGGAFCREEDCIMALEPSNPHSKALAGQLSIGSTSKIAGNVQRELERGNACALEALAEADEDVVFRGARVRLADVLRCTAATRTHLLAVAARLASVEAKLAAAVAELCVPAEPHPAFPAPEPAAAPEPAHSVDTSTRSAKRKCL